MKFSTAIIHRTVDKDRIPLIDKIREVIPDAALAIAFEPIWETQQDVRAIRGVSVSHLKAYTQMATPGQCHMNLEDDAVLVPEGYEALIKLEKLPDDCGVLLTGSVTPNAYKVGSLYEVTSPYHGAHGVLFNTPVLLGTHFLMHAYELLSTTHMADSACCFEGLLETALKRVGLRIYRQDTMAFGTAGGISSRTGRTHEPRSTTPLSIATQKQSPIPYFQP